MSNFPKPKSAVRYTHYLNRDKKTKEAYEVYNFENGMTLERFDFTNEKSRGIALGKANAMSNDLNKHSAPCEVTIPLGEPKTKRTMRYILEHEMDFEADYIFDSYKNRDDPIITIAPGNFELAQRIVDFLNFELAQRIVDFLNYFPPPEKETNK
jgi:hypothetical protein